MGQGSPVSRRALLASTAAALAACDKAPAPELGFADADWQRGHLLREQAMAPAGTPQRRVAVLIVGGGVAGLAAARALRLRGRDDFVVLELEDQAGGNARASALGGMPCPLGAHYLPLPGPAAVAVQDFLEELGLRQRIAGRWQYDPRHLCHAPQERLFFNGQWQDGVLPQHNVGAQTLADYQRFAALVRATHAAAPYQVPLRKGPFPPAHQALDAINFEAWLNQNRLNAAPLRWYLDYSCRDDYGAGMAEVSAWAGIHYFASRHGFSAPGQAEAPPEPVLTWPQGNGWLTQRLASPLGERLLTARVLRRMAEQRDGVVVDVWNAAQQAWERWLAARCIVALPVFAAARVLENPPALLQEAAQRLRYASWLVANLQLRAPLDDRPGAPLSWDNVVYGAPGLGYVNAGHQNLHPAPGATVLTYYRALGGERSARQQLLSATAPGLLSEIVAELHPAHPDLAEKLAAVQFTRYGHGMAIPTPGVASFLAEKGEIGLMGERGKLSKQQRLLFAHSDWAGYSVFEEAFTRGHAAGLAAAS